MHDEELENQDFARPLPTASPSMVEIALLTYNCDSFHYARDTLEIRDGSTTTLLCPLLVKIVAPKAV